MVVTEDSFKCNLNLFQAQQFHFLGDPERKRGLHVGQNSLQLALPGTVHLEFAGSDLVAGPRVLSRNTFLSY